MSFWHLWIGSKVSGLETEQGKRMKARRRIMYVDRKEMGPGGRNLVIHTLPQLLQIQGLLVK